MFDFSMMNNAIRIIKEGAKVSVDQKTYIAREIALRKSSNTWRNMIKGDDYYKGNHDIIKKVRTAIGVDGALEEVHNLPNNKIVDNVYNRMVKQKANYLCGKPFSIVVDNETYKAELSNYFDKKFSKSLLNLAKDSLNQGIAWLYIHYDEKGELTFKKFRPYEIIPLWKDVEHTQLEAIIRFYDVEYFNGTYDERITKVEYYTLEGVDYYIYKTSTLIPTEPYHTSYAKIDGMELNWDRLPFVAFKCNDNETSLLQACKSLQDGLNTILSNFQDNMEEDTRKTIMVLVNYDGQNLGEFRRNLSTYGAVKVRSTEGSQGDVKTLQVEVNAENYKTVASIFKKAIIENCMGYDAKDERLGGTPNQMNIQTMYNDIDLDASEMSREFTYSIDELLHFIDVDLALKGVGDFSNEEVDIIFNTDMPMDESVTLANIQASMGILSLETILANHPWVHNVDDELKRIEKEKQAVDTYADMSEGHVDE